MQPPEPDWRPTAAEYHSDRSLECAARDLRAAAPIIADRVSGTVSRTERRAPLPALTVGDGGAV